MDFECNPHMDNDNFFTFRTGISLERDTIEINKKKIGFHESPLTYSMFYSLHYSLPEDCSLEMSYAIHIHYLIYDSFLHRICTSTKVYLNLNINIDYLQSYKIAILDRNSLGDGHRVPNFPVSVYKNCKSICTMINIFMITSLLNSTCNKRRHLVTIFKIIIEQVCKNIVEE